MPRRRRPPRAGALSDLAPLRLAWQIALLQTLFYACAVVLMLFTILVAGMPFRLDLVLGWEPVRGDTTQGWLLAFVWFLDGGVCMALVIVALVARAKLVPDFVLTLHGLHLVIVSLYTHSLPRHAMWWATAAASSAVAIALASWGCRYRELQPVFFLFGGGGSTTATTTSSEHLLGRHDDHDAADLETGQGSRPVSAAAGRGRGKGGGGGGAREAGRAGSTGRLSSDRNAEYEMSKLEPAG